MVEWKRKDIILTSSVALSWNQKNDQFYNFYRVRIKKINQKSYRGELKCTKIAFLALSKND